MTNDLQGVPDANVAYAIDNFKQAGQTSLAESQSGHRQNMYLKHRRTVDINRIAAAQNSRSRAANTVQQ